MARNSSEVEQAVSRTLRDSLAKLQQTTGELDRAVSDLVSACASARPSNSLPPMLRARSAAAALAASLEVLSRFVITALQAAPAPTEQELQAIAPSAAATVEVASPLEPAELESAAPVEQPVEQIEPDASATVTVASGAGLAVFEAAASIVENAESREVALPGVPIELPYAEQTPGESPVTETIPESPDPQMREPGPDQSPEPAPEREPGPEPLPQREPPAEQPPNEMPEREPTPEPPPEQIPEREPEREQAPELEPVAAFAQQEQPLVPEFANADPTSAPFAASYGEDSPNEESSSDAVSFDVLALAPEQQELHRRANRVAKVSMQDVKMLRPRDVALGKENKDLCIRLRDDIEKAHKEYDRRFHSIMDHPVDYFYNWMVQILGDGDPQTLGEYPYPSPVLRR